MAPFIQSASPVSMGPVRVIVLEAPSSFRTVLIVAASTGSLARRWATSASALIGPAYLFIGVGLRRVFKYKPSGAPRRCNVRRRASHASFIALPNWPTKVVLRHNFAFDPEPNRNTNF